jgi:hypothetical protein
MELTASFMTLLDLFAPVFTTPSFATFRLLMTGWILSMRHRYVTDLIVSSHSVGNGHHSDYHRFFSHAKWDLDELWKRLACQLVDRLLGKEAIIVLAGDDTLCRKRGLRLFGAGMHHDPLISSRAMKLVSWGHDWVTLCLVIANPKWAPSKVFALPICMRLYRNKQGVTKGQSKSKRQSRAASKPSAKKTSQKRALQGRPGASRKPSSKQQNSKQSPQKQSSGAGHRTRPELMREMLERVAGWLPERSFLFVGDSLYAGESILKHLPKNIDMIGTVHPKGGLYEPAPQKQSGRGARRKKGNRLPTLEAWAASQTPWQSIKFAQFGLHGTLETKTREGLYYKAGKDRLLKFVLTRDVEGARPTRIFYCTNLELDIEIMLSTYAHRWAIEVTHHDAKQFLGFEDPANRLPLAVQRTAPMAMLLYSLTVLWYQEHGQQHVQFPNRPWYRRKREPSFADMLTTLRRKTWTDGISTMPLDSGVCENSVEQLIYLATLAG